MAAGLLHPAATATAEPRSDVQQRLAVVQSTLNKLAHLIGEAEARLQFANQAIAQHAQQMAQSSTGLHELKDSYARRSSELYMAGASGVVESLSQATSLDVFVERLGYLERVRAWEEGSRESYVALQHRSASDRAELEAARADAATAVKALTDQRAQLDAKLREYQSLLGIADLAGGRLGMTRASRSRSTAFLCPVNGAHGLDNNFGEPRPGGPHQGDDLPSNPGTPVVSVMPSRVVDVVSGGWMGKGVIIRDALRNEYWYAHLAVSVVSQGQALAAGEQIGRVGCTGRCSGPHLHFEYHPNGNAAQDPYKLLHAVC
ncbi:MAG: hypothetical protein NVSMB57_05560 [Actinomycetota bacterium]